MRRGRIFFYLALIVLLGLVGIVVVWQRFIAPAASTQTGPSAVPTPVIDVVNVLVITQRVPRGSIITREVISLVPIQRELFIQGMYSELSEVEGRLAKFDLEAGIFITSGMLADTADELSGFGSDAALLIPRGNVAVSVPISVLSKVSYPVQPGDHVNVIVTQSFVDIDTDYQSILPNQAADVIAPGVQPPEGVNYLTTRVQGGGFYGAPTIGRTEVIQGLGQSIYVLPSEKQRPRSVTQGILQNIVVLNVGNFSAALSGAAVAGPGASAEPTPTPVPGGEAPPPPPAADYISVITTPQDALMLNYLIANGAQLTLALRAAGDDSRVLTEAVTLQYYLNKYNVPIPVKLPYGLEPRVDNPVSPAAIGGGTP